MMIDARPLTGMRADLNRRGAKRRCPSVDIDRRRNTRGERRMPTIAVVGIAQTTDVLIFDFHPGRGAAYR